MAEKINFPQSGFYKHKYILNLLILLYQRYLKLLNKSSFMILSSKHLGNYSLAMSIFIITFTYCGPIKNDPGHKESKEKIQLSTQQQQQRNKELEDFMKNTSIVLHDPQMLDTINKVFEDTGFKFIHITGSHYRMQGPPVKILDTIDEHDTYSTYLQKLCKAVVLFHKNNQQLSDSNINSSAEGQLEEYFQSAIEICLISLAKGNKKEGFKQENDDLKKFLIINNICTSSYKVCEIIHEAFQESNQDQDQELKLDDSFYYNYKNAKFYFTRKDDNSDYRKLSNVDLTSLKTSYDAWEMLNFLIKLRATGKKNKDITEKTIFLLTIFSMKERTIKDLKSDSTDANIDIKKIYKTYIDKTSSSNIKSDNIFEIITYLRVIRRGEIEQLINKSGLMKNINDKILQNDILLKVFPYILFDLNYVGTFAYPYDKEKAENISKEIAKVVKETNNNIEIDTQYIDIAVDATLGKKSYSLISKSHWNSIRNKLIDFLRNIICNAFFSELTIKKFKDIINALIPNELTDDKSTDNLFQVLCNLKKIDDYLDSNKYKKKKNDILKIYTENYNNLKDKNKHRWVQYMQDKLTSIEQLARTQPMQSKPESESLKTCLEDIYGILHPSTIAE